MAVDEELSGRHVQLDAAHARAVLAAVVLLLHQQEEPPKAPERIPELLAIPGERPSEPDQRQAAFVGDAIAHGEPQA